MSGKYSVTKTASCCHDTNSACLSVNPLLRLYLYLNGNHHLFPLLFPFLFFFFFFFLLSISVISLYSPLGSGKGKQKIKKRNGSVQNTSNLLPKSLRSNNCRQSNPLLRRHLRLKAPQARYYAARRRHPQNRPHRRRLPIRTGHQRGALSGQPVRDAGRDMRKNAPYFHIPFPVRVGDVGSGVRQPPTATTLFCVKKDPPCRDQQQEDCAPDLAELQAARCTVTASSCCVHGQQPLQHQVWDFADHRG